MKSNVCLFSKLALKGIEIVSQKKECDLKQNVKNAFPSVECRDLWKILKLIPLSRDIIQSFLESNAKVVF